VVCKREKEDEMYERRIEEGLVEGGGVGGLKILVREKGDDRDRMIESELRVRGSALRAAPRRPGF
jgi:hypothetical protein